MLKKDIVHIIGTELYGIVGAPINDEDELKYRNCARNGEYSNWQVIVNLIYNGQRFLSVFSRDHIVPPDLELAEFEEGDVCKGMMVSMGKTLYANLLFDGSGRDAGRIAAVLTLRDRNCVETVSGYEFSATAN